MARRAYVKRLVHLIHAPDSDGVGAFCLVTAKKSAFYVFREIPSEIGGRGFALHRLGLSSLYHVRVGEPAECDCDCMGFLAHGKCKHVLGLRTLIDEGAI